MSASTKQLFQTVNSINETSYLDGIYVVEFNTRAYSANSNYSSGNDIRNFLENFYDTQLYCGDGNNGSTFFRLNFSAEQAANARQKTNELREQIVVELRAVPSAKAAGNVLGNAEQRPNFTRVEFGFGSGGGSIY